MALGDLSQIHDLRGYSYIYAILTDYENLQIMSLIYWVTFARGETAQMKDQTTFAKMCGFCANKCCGGATGFAPEP